MEVKHKGQKEDQQLYQKVQKTEENLQRTTETTDNMEQQQHHNIQEQQEQKQKQLDYDELNEEMKCKKEATYVKEETTTTITITTTKTDLEEEFVQNDHQQQQEQQQQIDSTCISVITTSCCVTGHHHDNIHNEKHQHQKPGNSSIVGGGNNTNNDLVVDVTDKNEIVEQQQQQQQPLRKSRIHKNDNNTNTNNNSNVEEEMNPTTMELNDNVQLQQQQQPRIQHDELQQEEENENEQQQQQHPLLEEELQHLLLQEEEEIEVEQQQQQIHHHHQHHQPFMVQQQLNRNHETNYWFFGILTYRQFSFSLFISYIYYAFRTRKQYYITMVYMSSSKYAYLIGGNAILASAVLCFDAVVHIFLKNLPDHHYNARNPQPNNQQQYNNGGLRQQEADGLHDFIRWNITETCLALTMFRSELTIVTMIQFVMIITCKCLHHVAQLREQHLRLTQETIITSIDYYALSSSTTSTTSQQQNPIENNDNNIQNKIMILTNSYPIIRRNHRRILLFFIVLQLVDLYVLQHTVTNILTNGVTVSILFVFESAIMLLSSWSHILLWNLHCLDSILLYGHEKRAELIQLYEELEEEYQQQQNQQQDENEEDVSTEEQQNLNQQRRPPNLPYRGTVFLNLCHNCFHTWKEFKATFQFAVQLQSLTIQFLCYVFFFAIVLHYYGLPINLFREVYMSFTTLKKQIISFYKYRQLMASMDRFHDVQDVNEMQNHGGSICIICRDEMTIRDCKRLPGCNHIFHKSCLREWLAQQQSCPTCRADIRANETLERTRQRNIQAVINRNNNNNNNIAGDGAAAAVAAEGGDIGAEPAAAAAVGAAQVDPPPGTVGFVNNNNIANNNITPQDTPLGLNIGVVTDDRNGNDSNNTNTTRNDTSAAVESPTVVSPSMETGMNTNNLNQTGGTLLHATDADSVTNQKKLELDRCLEESRQFIRLMETVYHRTPPTTTMTTQIHNDEQQHVHKEESHDTVPTTPTSNTTNPKSFFPAIYQVIERTGAIVYTNVMNHEVDVGTTTRLGHRTIPFGTLLLGQGIIATTIKSPSLSSSSPPIGPTPASSSSSSDETVPVGTIANDINLSITTAVNGTKEKEEDGGRTDQGSISGHVHYHYIRIPDGWVQETSIGRVATIRFQ